MKDALKEIRLGETRQAKNGLSMTIIEYNNSKDIVVRFEDNYEKKTTYRLFKQGSVKNPNVNQRTIVSEKYKNNYLGKTVETHYGTCRIVEYNRANNIIVEFDNGERVRTDLTSFRRGYIKPASISNDTRLVQNKKNRIGEEFINNKGEKAKIVEYIDAKHITIQFEDGTIGKNKRYFALLKGQFQKDFNNSNRIGERRLMNCGVVAEIVEYNSYDNMTIRFDTGEIRNRVHYTKFCRGAVSITGKHKLDSERIGYTFRTACGLNAKIVEYKEANNITIEFEDDTVIEHTRYSRILRGHIKHPTITSQGTGTLKSFKLHKRVYSDKDITLYHCTCQKCGIENVLTPQEMLKHECN